MLLWLSLAVFVVALAGGTAFTVTRALAVLRATRRLLGAVAKAVDSVSAAAAAMAERQPRDRGRLDRSLARLRLSQARLQILVGAVGRVRAHGRRVTAAYPRK